MYIGTSEITVMDMAEMDRKTTDITGMENTVITPAIVSSTLD